MYNDSCSWKQHLAAPKCVAVAAARAAGGGAEGAIATAPKYGQNASW